MNQDRLTTAKQPFHKVQSAINLMSKQTYTRNGEEHSNEQWQWHVHKAWPIY